MSCLKNHCIAYRLMLLCLYNSSASGSSAVPETGRKLIANASPDSVARPAVAQPVSNLLPSSYDFIVSYATLPKSVAYADRESGGLYVRALCKNLKEDYEIDVALKKVSSDVNTLLKDYSEKHDESYTVQKPFHICITQKSLFLCAEMWNAVFIAGHDSQWRRHTRALPWQKYLRPGYCPGCQKWYNKKLYIKIFWLPLLMRIMTCLCPAMSSGLAPPLIPVCWALVVAAS